MASDWNCQILPNRFQHEIYTGFPISLKLNKRYVMWPKNFIDVTSNDLTASWQTSQRKLIFTRTQTFYYSFCCLSYTLIYSHILTLLTPLMFHYFADDIKSHRMLLFVAKVDERPTILGCISARLSRHMFLCHDRPLERVTQRCTSVKLCLFLNYVFPTRCTITLFRKRPYISNKSQSSY